ncbi:hypothetical protein LR48_Vigan10g273000 [Vigna angularis]|uniref:Reverse transcriptase Ty1/copia-type domain-containing protein n=1 Tax=Phaseolus angularis TaxID=3914 RepID=A0A0L9VPF1_PHAAN|nr:hypothetical protein LR48_Vigan10g273000 [Vigna angularis]
MAGIGGIQGQLPVFDGKLFDDWRIKMQAIFGFQDVSEVIEDGLPDLSERATKEEKRSYKLQVKLDSKARFLLYQCVSPKIFNKISKASTAKEVWDILVKMYGDGDKNKKVKLQALRRQFEILIMDEGETVAEYFDKVQELVNKMRACKDTISDEYIVDKILIVMHQSRYVLDLLKRFEMVDCNAANTPAELGLRLEKEPNEEAVDPTAYRSIVGSLRYLCNTRPDLSYSVGVVSRYMECPRLSHLNAVKRILRYLQGTHSYGILLGRGETGEEVQITSYSDADWCGDKEDRKSTAGYIFFMGGTPISWSSRKEPVVALSSCEAEYIAACEATCQATWLGFLLEGLKIELTGRVRLLVDNKSAIDLAKHPASHGRSKHIETRFHYIREQVSSGRLDVVHCRSEDQLADILTKALKSERFQSLRKQIGMVRAEISEDRTRRTAKT